MARAKKGDTVETLKPIIHRVAFYTREGKPGRTKVSFSKGERLKAATDSLGGNIYVHATTGEGDPVVVPPAEDEWKKVPAGS